MLYREALQNAKQGELNATLFTLRRLLRDYPDSRYVADTKFALGEYYFRENVYQDSYNIFLDFLENYPEHQATPFALAMIHKLLMKYNQGKMYMPLNEKIRNKFFNKPLFLLFSKSRNKTYHSLLNTRFIIREYIDKIEILKDNETFLVVRP